MSAYQVTDATIDTIVAAAHKYRVIRKSSATVIGQAVKRQNTYALTVRYPADTDTPALLLAQPDYTYTPFPRYLKRAAIDGAIRCWQYQCGEFAGVDQTAISLLVAEVKDRNRNRILDRDPDHDFIGGSHWDVADRDTVMVAPRPPVLYVTSDEDEDEEVDGDEYGEDDPAVDIDGDDDEDDDEFVPEEGVMAAEGDIIHDEDESGV
jgi:hypothetical protein